MSTLPPGIIRTSEGIHVLANDSHLSRWIEQSRRLDIAKEEIMRFFAPFIPQGGTVLDAGACLGDHTATYAELVGPTGRVIALEPGDLTYQALSLNFRDIPHVFTYHAALGQHEGRAHHSIAENAGGSHLGDGPENVEVTTIDALKLERLDFAHIDAEGSEVAILLGARETMKRLAPVMALEINQGALGRFGYTQDDVYRALDAVGYSWRELLQENGRHLEQRDILAWRGK